MPDYDEVTMSNEDLQTVVDYLLIPTPDNTQSAPAPDGVELLEESGCLGCHTTDGSKSIAPSFKGIGQREVTIIRDGKEITIKVDAEYLRRSMMTPNADLVKGYMAMMPAAIYLSPEEIDAIIQHLLQQ